MTEDQLKFSFPLPMPQKASKLAYIKLTRPDGKPVWLDKTQRPRRISYPLDAKGNAELFWGINDFETVKEWPDDIKKLFEEP